MTALPPGWVEFSTPFPPEHRKDCLKMGANLVMHRQFKLAHVKVMPVKEGFSVFVYKPDSTLPAKRKPYTKKKELSRWATSKLTLAIQDAGLTESFRELCKGGAGYRNRIKYWASKHPALAGLSIPMELHHVRAALGAEPTRHGGRRDV